MRERYEDYGIMEVDYSRKGEQRTTCPECSASRKKANDKCLAVNVDEGIWYCHHCSWNGVLKEIKDYVPKPAPKPIVTKPSDDIDKMYEYFKKRSIGVDTLKTMKITLEKMYSPIQAQEVNVICFPYYVDGVHVNTKYRDAKKNFIQKTGGKQCFYNLDSIKDFDSAVITEGEIDALSFHESGIRNAISVPGGGIQPNAKNPKMEYIEHGLPYLEKKKIYLATDNDLVGVRLREELARRLGKHRCMVIDFPEGCKDANDVLKKHGIGKLREIYEGATPYPIEGVYSPKSRQKELRELYLKGFPNGATYGYPDFDRLFRFLAGQLTVVTGIPGHGKSNFMDQVAIKLSSREGWRWAVFSPENQQIEIHVKRLLEILVGKPFLPHKNNRITEEEFEAGLDFLEEHFNFILPKEDFSFDNIMDAAKMLVAQKGINGFILDPWNTIEHKISQGENETLYTGKILNQLKYFAREADVHVFLVAHPTKMRKSGDSNLYEIPKPYDISGSANWYNVPDNCWSVYRHFTEDYAETKYTSVIVQKVKHEYIGKLGFAKFKFDISNRRFIPYDKEQDQESELEKFDYSWDEPYMNQNDKEDW
jgi:twinkle protein